MGGQVNWLYRDRIIHQLFYGDTTVEDIADVAEKTHDLIEAGQAPVHILLDGRFVKKFPIKLGVLRDAWLQDMRTNKLGWVLVLNSSNPLQKFVTSVLAQTPVVAVNMRTFDTFEQVLRFLLPMDATLGDDIRSITLPEAPPTEQHSK